MQEIFEDLAKSLYFGLDLISIINKIFYLFKKFLILSYIYIVKNGGMFQK